MIVSLNCDFRQFQTLENEFQKFLLDFDIDRLILLSPKPCKENKNQKK